MHVLYLELSMRLLFREVAPALSEKGVLHPTCGFITGAHPRANSGCTQGQISLDPMEGTPKLGANS
jgi:hypothetical protein